jgi:saccharopine dehydrogenase-like NADP-dependent oxidoreductase
VPACDKLEGFICNSLILGAHGQIAHVATDLFLEQIDARLTLYLRSAKRLQLSGKANRVRVVKGDVLDMQTLEGAMAGQDVVYATLAGQVEQQARTSTGTTFVLSNSVVPMILLPARAPAQAICSAS